MTDAHRTELVRAPAAPLAPDRALHPLIAQLAAGNIDPATIGKMMDLQERHEATEAKKAYTRALTALKAVLPRVIAKDGKVDYEGTNNKRVTYTHATLAGVVDAVTEHLTAHGFSISWVPARLPSGHVSVTCRLTHCEGHSESCALDATVDASGGKNAVQAVASTVTYLERYTILSLLGIATRDMKEPTDEGSKVEPHGEGVDSRRNLAAVSALQKAGLDVAEVETSLGRKAPAWTAADRERVRDLLPKKRQAASKPVELDDGSMSEDPPQ